MVLSRAKRWRWEELEKDSIELGTLAREFEFYNRTEGKSQSTIDWYNLALKQLQRFPSKGERSSVLAGLGEPEVREFILYLQDRNRWQDNPYVSNRQGKLKAISIQTYVRALRAFFNWLYKEGYTTENRLANLKPPKAPTKVVEILTEQEIPKVLPANRDDIEMEITLKLKDENDWGTPSILKASSRVLIIRVYPQE